MSEKLFSSLSNRRCDNGKCFGRDAYRPAKVEGGMVAGQNVHLNSSFLMPTLKSITFAYRAQEDRVLAAINLGQADTWSCWLTRRLSLAVLERAGTFVASTSPLAKAHRAELPQ
jgi:hypothetical protein